MLKETLFTPARKLERVAHTLALELLGTAGEPPDHWEQANLVWHLRRRLTDREIQGLPAEWLAIKPIDG